MREASSWPRRCTGRRRRPAAELRADRVDGVAEALGTLLPEYRRRREPWRATR